MKKKIKILLSIMVLIAMIFFPLNARATNNGISINYNINASSSSVYVGSTFNVYVNVSGASNGIASNTITLNYDTNKFAFVSASAPSPSRASDVTINNKGGEIIFLYVDGAGGTNALYSSNVAVFTFKALNTTGTGSFSFTASGSGDNEGNDYNIAGASGSTNVTVTNAPATSSNNNLSSLSVTGGILNPSFNKNTTTYNVTVDAQGTNISATAEDSTASIQGTGYANLNFGVNTYYITVTAQNGAVKRYTLNITRPVKGSTNVALESLSVSNTTIKYNGGYSYSYTVANNVKKITITAKASDSKTKITGTGDFYLSVGENNFTVEAISESGISASYNIVITRNNKSSFLSGVDENPKPNNPDPEPTPEPEPSVETDIKANNYLKSAGVTGGEFNFTKDKLNYLVTVPYTQEVLELTYETENPNAKVRVIADDTLKVGSNNAFIEVVAENGETRTYQIIITRNDETPITDFNTEALITALDTQEMVATKVMQTADTMLLDQAVVIKLKETQKTLMVKIVDEFDNIIGELILDGHNISDTSSINFSLKNAITDEKLLQNLKGDYTGFNTTETNIPAQTIYRHYINSIKDLYTLYYIKDNKVVNEDLAITNGYVEFTIDNNASYAIIQTLDSAPSKEEDTTIAKETKSNKKLSKWVLVGGGSLALASGAVLGIASAIKKKKKSGMVASEVEYLDLMPQTDVYTAPAVSNTPIETIPAMDTLNIEEEVLSSEPQIEILAIPNPSEEAKDNTTGAVENYHYEWQKEYFNTSQDDELLQDPKYEIRPILSAEAIAETFIDAKIEFDFEPIYPKEQVTVQDNQNLVMPNGQITND